MNSHLFHIQLKKARRAKGWNQAELARRAGLQPSAISHFETGRRSPSLQNFAILGNVLKVSADYLLSNGPLRPKRARAPYNPMATCNPYQRGARK